MAEDKKGFVLYADLIHTIDKMPNDKAGELFKHILKYVNDLNPETEDLIIQLTFEPIKQQLKRDLEKYNKSKEDKSLQGRIGNLKRWNIDIYNKYELNELSLEQAEEIAKNRKASLTDDKQSQSIANIAVKDKVNVIVKDNVINKTIPSIDEFVAYAISLKQNVNIENVKLKYNSWLVNDWKVNRQGKEKEIKNWKSTLSNTLQYLGEHESKIVTPDNLTPDVLYIMKQTGLTYEQLKG